MWDFEHYNPIPGNDHAIKVDPPDKDFDKGVSTVTFRNRAKVAVRIYFPPELNAQPDCVELPPKMKPDEYREVTITCTDPGHYTCQAIPVLESCPTCGQRVAGGFLTHAPAWVPARMVLSTDGGAAMQEASAAGSDGDPVIIIRQ